MNGQIKYLLSVFFCLLSFIAGAQKKLPSGYFRSPLDINLFVTAAFGEVRRDHLHSGIDFSTGNKTGQNVYAVADGYISRIKVASGGYGKVIYVTHPNGFVSVYGHLDEFNVVVEDYVFRKQYEKESFEIELFPNPVLFKVKKGDIVGYSGNSGATTGPHLHFEIRSEKSERIINPALFGVYPGDVTSPVIKAVRIYQNSTYDSVNGNNEFIEYLLKTSKNEIDYNITDTAMITGACYFGIMAEDIVSASNVTGPYSVDMFVDSMKYFSYVMDSFAFDDGRYVNDLIDYSENVKTQRTYLLLRVSPANELPVYRNIINRGILYFDKKETHGIEIIVRDFTGNKAVLRFVVTGKPSDKKITQERPKNKPVYNFNVPNHFETRDLKLDFPAFCFYDSLVFTYKMLKNPLNNFSSMHNIHNKYVPLHKAFDIAIRADSIPEPYKNKAVIVRYGNTGELTSIGGTVMNGYIKSKADQFGDYLVAIDTSAPRVVPVNFNEGNKINATEKLYLKATDNLSGIASYRAEANGKWVLMEYDAKNDLLIIPLSNKIPEGSFDLVVRVKDKCSNETIVRYHLRK